jgi:hypothetical protein
MLTPAYNNAWRPVVPTFGAFESQSCDYFHLNRRHFMPAARANSIWVFNDEGGSDVRHGKCDAGLLTQGLMVSFDLQTKHPIRCL